MATGATSAVSATTAASSARRPKRLGPLEIVFVVAAVACSMFFASVERFGHGVHIWGDGLGYYTWARSAVVDRDLDFKDEYTLAPVNGYPLSNARWTPIGRPANKYPIGLALIELPPVIFAYAVDRIEQGESDRPGYGRLYELSVMLYLCLGGLGALYVTFRRLREKGDRSWIVLLAIGALFATNLPEYLTRSVSYAHLANVALIGLVWTLGQRRTAWAPLSSIVIGLLIGLTVVVRNTNVLVVPWMVAGFYDAPSKPKPRDLAWVALGIVPPLLLQLGATFAVWGTAFVEPYPGESFEWGNARLWDSLFSLERGWLLWHPWFLVLLALMLVSWPRHGSGASDASRAERATYATCALACVGHWVLNSAWWCWTFGFSFGNRGYLALLPVLTITVARSPRLREGLRDGRRRLVAVAVVALLVVWNLNLWSGFLVASSIEGSSDPTLAESASWLLRP